MDDKTFTREKFRRELQELLHIADEATVAAEEGDEEESKKKDIMLALKLLQLNLVTKELGEILLEVKTNP